jgi:hypothetical protein
VIDCTTTESIQLSLRKISESRTLYVILVASALLKDAGMNDALNQLAGAIPDNDAVGLSVLLYAFSEEGLDELPLSLRKRQARETARLGERRGRPLNLALQALHRARLVLGQSPEQSQLQLFLSHAKADGLFFARALREAISVVPELECFYDDDELDSGATWQQKLESAASQGVLIALRTPNYEQRRACRSEFETALRHGVPIVVVDALSTELVNGPSHLPFSAMPTVRIVDGNTHRVISAALREHLRLLLMQAIARENVLVEDDTQIRVWPRFPSLADIDLQSQERQSWFVPQSLVLEKEFEALRKLLNSVQSKITLGYLETQSAS